MPLGFDKLLHHNSELSPPPSPRKISTQRIYHLHVRQQPLVARTCGAGDRERRLIDPPPIVQFLLSDFDPGMSDDHDILQDPRFTVGCFLFPVSDTSSRSRPPKTDQEGAPERENESDGVARADHTFSTPVLSGKTFMSPFYFDPDPDPNSAPIQLFSHDSNPGKCSFPSPTNLDNAPKLHHHATFFRFADLFIRAAGMYRLRFQLMNWGLVEDTGQSMPILAETWSDPFLVYRAKDFPGMCDYSVLADGLKELGFAELRTRGKSRGKGRKKC